MPDERKVPGLPVDVGTTIYVEGHAYVISAVQRTKTAEGATVLLNGLDAGTVERLRAQAEQAAMALAATRGKQTPRGNA